MLHRHTLRAETPDGARQLCDMNNACSVHSHMSCVDAERSYSGSWTLTLWDDLILSRTQGIGLHYSRGPEHIRDDVNDSVFIHFNLGTGSVGGRQMGRDYVLTAGGGGVFVHNEPVSVGLYDGADILGLALPREATRRWTVAPEDAAARDLPADGFAFGMLRHYLEVLSRSDLTPGESAIARSHMADLAGLWLGGLRHQGQDRTAAARQAARALAIRDHVARHFNDPGLSLASMARALGMSSRLAQQVLQADGTHFSRLVTEARLTAAARWLGDPGLRGQSVTEIAFACGFNDLSAFYKAFSARFDMAPGRYRMHRE